MNNKRGQVSVEFALLIGFITFLLIAIIGIAYYYSGTAKTQIKVNSIDKVGKKIADTADSICYLGVPSKATIQITIPEGVTNSIFYDTPPYGVKFVVTIKGATTSDMVYKTQCELKDVNNDLTGPAGSFTKAGTKSLKIEALAGQTLTYVEISKSS